MKAFVDNQLIRKIAVSEDGHGKNLLLDACLNAGILTEDQRLQIIFGWPSLLAYLQLESLFEKFPAFDNQNELFAFIVSLLPQESEKELLIRLYDQVFVECLTHIKSLPQIQPAFLIQQIREKRPPSLLSQANKLFAPSLDRYEKLLVEHPANTMHDLILYLAWDRVCVNLAIAFEHIVPNADILKGLAILKECLLESFQHITGHGRTSPGFFRLIEALYAYQMREENLQIHTDAEWLTLCQSAKALRPREQLHDIFYIDAAVVDDQNLKEKESLKVLTLDSAEKVKASLLLARYMVDKLKREEAGWHYTLSPMEIVCLNEKKSGGFVVDEIIQ